MNFWSERLRAAVRQPRGQYFTSSKARRASDMAMWGVLVVLVDECNEFGEVSDVLRFPERRVPATVVNIGKACFLSERTTRAAIAGLADLGMVTVHKNPSGMDRYTVNFDSFGDTSCPSRAPSTGNYSQPGRQPSPMRAANTAIQDGESGHPFLMDPEEGSEERGSEERSDSAVSRPPDAGEAHHGVTIPSPPPTLNSAKHEAPIVEQQALLALEAVKAEAKKSSKAAASHEPSAVSEPPASTAKPEPDTPRTEAKRREQAAAVTDVLTHWSKAPFHRRTPKITEIRRKRVAARLAEGFTPDDLKTAVDGAYLDDWLMGREARSNGKAYHDVETLFRDAGIVERLLDLHAKAQPVTNAEDLAWSRAWCKAHIHDQLVRKIIAEKRAPQIRELEAMRRADERGGVTSDRWSNGGGRGPNGGHIVQPAANNGPHDGGRTWKMAKGAK